MFEYICSTFPMLPVKVGSLVNKQSVETMPLEAYYSNVCESYAEGTFRLALLFIFSFTHASADGSTVIMFCTSLHAGKISLWEEDVL